MRVTVFALGSRGDVQPYIALAKGLKAAGHHPRLMTHTNFQTLVESHGLPFWPARGNVQEVAESEEMRRLLEKGNFLAISRYTAQAAQQAARQWVEDGLDACRGTDLLIAGMGGLNVAVALAQKLAIPMIQAYLVPFTPTAAFPGPLVPGSLPRLGGAFNRLTHQLTRQMMWQPFRAADRQARQEILGLPAAPFFGPYHAGPLKGNPVLYGFSPSVIGKPADWDGSTHITGYWFLDADDQWSPPAPLAAFLQAGPPPVYVGFGSMGSRRPEETADLVLQALAAAGQRAILMSGWGGLSKAELPDSIFMIDSIPHAWLFPRVAAVVHHGGAGTTAAGLRAGIPSIIIPFFGDQGFWGQRVAHLGVGPAPIPRKKLTAEQLAQAIQTALTDQTMRQRAAELGEIIRAEDGIERAVALIGQFEKQGAA